MDSSRVLFISGSIGLGHVTRDIAIAREIRRQRPNVDIVWLAAHPASQFLEGAGETVVAEAAQYVNENDLAEKSARGSKLNLLDYLLQARAAWRQNVNVFADVVAARQYDLVIGDETYEINLALRRRRDLKNFKFVMIYDFVGLDPMTGNPLDRFFVHLWNRKWSHDYRKRRQPPYDLGLFVGEPEDVPDRSFGPMLPNRRQFALAMYKFIGYVFPFRPSDLRNRGEVRKRLGYGSEPLVVASIGGTSIGRELLELCGDAFRILREEMPALQMILVAGPRLETQSLRVPKEVGLRSYVPNLYEHFASCDLAIVQGGATSTLELTALRRPFIYFPIEGHSEQANVARMLERRKAGVRMSISQTSPAALARRISQLLHTEPVYPEIPADGAREGARLIVDLLERGRHPDPDAGRPAIRHSHT